MTNWAGFERSQPDLARSVRERFDIRKHKTLATIRSDGSPRISGIEMEFDGAEVYVGMMPASRKLADLLRDPRLAIHSPTEEPPEDDPSRWKGEAKLGGRALEVDFPESPIAGARRFRVDIQEVSFVHLNQAGDRLVVEWWREGRGLRRLERE